MRNAYALTLPLLLSLLFVSSGIAQEALTLPAGSFELNTTGSDKFSAASLQGWPSHSGYNYGVIALQTLPNTDQRDQLEEQGIIILEYLQGSSYLVAVQHGASFEVLNSLGVSGLRPWSADMKFVNDGAVPSIAHAKGNNVLVNLHYFETVEPAALVGSLTEAAEVVDERPTYGFITVEVDESLVADLASLPAVKFMDWKYDYGEPENYTSRNGHRVNYLSPESNNGLSFNGEGINVMLQDDGFIGPHIDFHGRIGAQYWSGNLGDHGDHVGGTIAGAGNIDPYAKGQAEGANLWVYKAAPEYQGFDSIDIHYVTKDVVITSTSYSNGCNSGYTSLARAMDDQVYNMESLMHVFSAGNSGTSDCGYGAGNEWGNITGGHKMGKNVITVGNLLDTDVISNSSSRGPATDGRIKPDLCTKGTSVWSTTDPNDYTFKSGTSMSCPGVSGVLAVLYEAYESMNGSLPPAGLIKAAMLNTCDDLGNPGPDFIYGWGRVNARKAYETFANNNIINGMLANQDSVIHTINVPAEIAQLKVMVYWTDPEASVSASTHLVNDLDMTMTDPNNVEHLRWSLDPSPSISSLSSPAVAGEDHLNNMEQIVIDDPASGSYAVKLKGYNVPMGPQEYYLVYWFEPKSITITYPAGGENFTPFVDEMIRWDGPKTTGTYTIEYSPDGSNWSTIAASVPGDQSYFNWDNPPNISTPDARLRITDNANNLTTTSEPFHIMRIPLGLTVDYSCPDSIGLSWNSLSQADEFDVYALGSKYMEIIGSSTTNEFVHYNANPFSDMLWYSVRARDNAGSTGKRADAINKPPGIFNCILPLDLELTELLPNGGAFYTCHSDTGFAIGFSVFNSGTTPVTSFDATLTSASGTPMQQTFTANIAPNSADSFYFSSNLTGITGLEQVSVVIDLPNDANPYNDSAIVYFQEMNATLEQPQFREDFEDFTLCSPAPNCEAVECALINGWHNEQNLFVDQIDWRVDNAGTPSDGTGPTIDHNPGNFGGKYLYLEASGDCEVREGSLISPCIDILYAQTAELTFWYHMFGTDMGTLSLDIFDGQQWILDVTPMLIGNQGDAWQERTVDLTPYVGNIINLRFRGVTGTDFRSDMAIDDISVLVPPVANFTFEINQPTDVLFTDLSAYGDTMTFDLGDGMVMDTVPGLYTYAQITSYVVEQMVVNEVGADTFTQLIQGLGVDDLREQGVNLYPNPANESFVIEQQSLNIQSVTIYDSSGKLVDRFQTPATLRERYDVSHLKPGLYMIRLSGESEVVTPLSIIR